MKNNILYILLFVFFGCSTTEEKKMDKSMQSIEEKHSRAADVIRLLMDNKMEIPKNTETRVYIFIEGSCIKCVKDKFNASMQLLNSTKMKTILIVDETESWMKESIYNMNVQTLPVKMESLERRGLKFAMPMLFCFHADGGSEAYDLDISFFENIDSLKVELNL